MYHKATGSSVEVVLRNGMGYGLEDVYVYVPECGEAVAGSPSDDDLDNGEQTKYTVTCAVGTTLSGKFSGTLNVSYKITDTGLTHSSIGSIITKVE